MVQRLFSRSLCVSMLLCLVGPMTGCSSGRVDWANVDAPKGTGFLTKSFTHEGKSQNYTVFVPHNYQPTQKYPVIMFLHGVLEGGSDGKKCVTVGIGPHVSQKARTFPFFVVFPQSGSDWVGESKEKLAIATLDQVLKDYPGADADRVVLTGLSNGGDGTWALGASHRERFAALVPMCGSPDFDQVPRLTSIPIWAFHNSVDPFRSSGKVKDMVKKIEAAGGNVKYTQYGGFGHDCWTQAYTEGEVLTWMQQQRRGAVAGKSANAGVKNDSHTP